MEVLFQCVYMVALGSYLPNGKNYWKLQLANKIRSTLFFVILREMQLKISRDCLSQEGFVGVYIAGAERLSKHKSQVTTSVPSDGTSWGRGGFLRYSCNKVF